jgi:hypothetical protein
MLMALTGKMLILVSLILFVVLSVRVGVLLGLVQSPVSHAANCPSTSE